MRGPGGQWRERWCVSCAMDLEYYERRAAELCESPMRRQPDPPTPPKTITGGHIFFEFHGIPPNDAYLQQGVNVIKHKRGIKVKEEFTFFDEVPLHRVVGVGFEAAPDVCAFKTLEELVEHGLRMRLGFSVSDLAVCRMPR